MKNLVIILCLIFVLSSCVIEQRSAFFNHTKVDGCTFSVDPLTGLSIKWEKTRFPVPFYVHESVPPKAYYNFVSAIKYWNLVWLDYLHEKGVEAPPLFDIIGENELFSTLPKRDGYNVLFFTDQFSGQFGGGLGSLNSKKIQAITVVRRTKDEIKDTDIVVNSGDFKFFYDAYYNEDVRLASQNRNSPRNLSSSRDLTFMESIKRKLFSFMKGFLKLLKGETLRGIAAREALVPKGLVDFPSLMIHELGHVPGLFHSDDKSVLSMRNNGRASSSHRIRGNSIPSVMKINLPKGSSRRKIGQFDLDNLFCGYYGGTR